MQTRGRDEENGVDGDIAVGSAYRFVFLPIIELVGYGS